MPILSAFPGFCPLLELYRPRRFTGQIIEYPVNPPHFIYDPAHHPIKHFIRDLRRLSCHEVNRLHRSQCHGIVICPFISHNSDASHICQRRKVLVDLSVQSGICDLFPVDRVRKIASASCTMRTFSAVTSPMMRIPSPGPGNG